MGLWDRRVTVTPLQTSSFGGNSSSMSSAFGGGGGGGDAAAMLQQQMDAANKANTKRGKAQIAGYDSAIGEAKNLGQQELQRIDKQERNNMSAGTSSLISRGLFNSSALNAEQTRVGENANDARLGAKQAQSGMLAALMMKRGDAIASQNDIGPDPALYAQLQQQAAQGAAVQGAGMRTSTVTNGSINDPIQFGSGGQQTVQPQAPAQQGQYYSAAAAQPQQAPQQQQSNVGSLLAAYGAAGGAPQSNYSPTMEAQGYGAKGSMSMIYRPKNGTKVSVL